MVRRNNVITKEEDVSAQRKALRVISVNGATPKTSTPVTQRNLEAHASVSFFPLGYAII